MKQIKSQHPWRPPVAVALWVASGLGAVVIALALGDLALYPIVLLFVVAAAILLGLPVYALLSRAGLLRWPTAALGGAVVAGLPALLPLLGTAATEASVGEVTTVEGGHYTWAGVAQIAGSAALFAVLGAACGLFAWWISAAARSRAQLVVLSTLPVLAMAAAFATSQITRDRSCHNVLRGGRNGVGTVASFDAVVARADWPAFADDLGRFAAARGWSVRRDVGPDPGFPWFQVSICRDDGTDVLAQYVSFWPGEIDVSVYQPQGGNGWIGPSRALLRQLGRRWPLRFRNGKGDLLTRAPVWVDSDPPPTPPALPSAAR